MPGPAFPPNTLDDEGSPVWIAGLAEDDEPHHTLHVVRGLEPADALTTLGAKPHLFRPCELPAGKPDARTSLPAAAIGTESGAALLAGQVGEWTFVYDDSGFTSHEDTTVLSAHRRTAATSSLSVDLEAVLTYSVDGNQLAWVTADELGVEPEVPFLPPELRAAFNTAGRFRNGQPGPDDEFYDYQVCMRAICALAGLYCTVDDLRRIPLLVTPLG